MMEKPILSDLFKKRLSDIEEDLFRVDLYKNRLEIKSVRQDKNECLKLFLNDIAGSIAEEPFRTNDTNAYLIIHAYPRSASNKLKRRKLTLEFLYSQNKSASDNLRRVKTWDEKIKGLLRNSSNETKPFLVFVNPVSGSGNARKIILKHVLKVWNESNISNKVLLTEYSNFARDYIQTIDLNEYRGIIVVSGDGLIHEVINGLLLRPDWQNAIKMPLGHIPAGSANGLASTVAYLNNETFQNIPLEYFATHMAFNLNKYAAKPLDLVRIQLENGAIVHSFLNVEWAIIADVDLESEKYRYLGALRFLVGALSRILNLRVYKGKISFLPVDECKNYQPKNPSIKVLKNLNNYTIEENDSNKMDPWSTSTKNSFKYLKPFDKSVPNNWLTIEDEFVLFLVLNLPLMGQDLFVSPDAKCDDDTLILAFVKKGATKKELLDLFNYAGNGKFLENSFIEYVKVKAFRLEPIHNPSFNYEHAALMVDGERVPYGRIQGEIIPKFGRILNGV